MEVNQAFNRARFQGVEGNPYGISRLQWLEGTDQAWWVQQVVDDVRTEVEEMLFCRTMIEREGTERGRRWRKKRRIVSLQWRWGRSRDGEMGTVKAFAAFFKSSELSRSRGPRHVWEFCEKVGVKHWNCSCRQTSENCKFVKKISFCNHFATHQTHPFLAVAGF